MNHHGRFSRTGVIAVFLLCGAGALPAAASVVDGIEGVAAVAEPFCAAKKVDPALLDEQRGGADTVYNDIQTTGVVGNNQAWNLNTGTNTIADGAFVGANGLSTVVQNSGNNVLIQNSTIINIQLR